MKSTIARLARQAVSVFVLVFPGAASALSTGLVISQVYGGGGNTGAAYTHDFVELHNNSGSPINLNGLAIQYASATGTGTWLVNALPNQDVPAGGYFLIQLFSAGVVGAALPPPDYIVSVNPHNMSAANGKVALTSTTVAMSGTCPNVMVTIDFVGYGATANCSESAPAPTTSSSLAAFRNSGGCAETDNNASDFSVLAPNPRNSSNAMLCAVTMNETNDPAEADYCAVIFPTTINGTAGSTSPNVYVQLYEAGQTEVDGPPAGWVAQVGYGPAGVNPATQAGYLWTSSTWNIQAGNNDEFAATFTLPADGTYWYAGRVSPDGVRWTYCDTDGAGSNPMLEFSAMQLGVLTVGAGTTPPTVATSAPSALFGTSVTMNGSANPNGANTTAWFRYSDVHPGSCNDTFGTRAPGMGGEALGSGSTDVPFSQSLSGLVADQTYYYCAIASNAGGTSVGLIFSFTTTSAVPPAITATSASGVTTTTALLNAAANPNGYSTTGWFRYSDTNPGMCNDTFGTRVPSGGGGQSLGSGGAPAAYQEMIGGLTPATTYYFCAIALSPGGYGFGSVVSFTTPAPVPSASTLAASAVTATGATLNGTANPNGVDTTAWFRYGAMNPGTCNDSFGTRAPGMGGSPMGSGSSSAPYSQSITGLAGGTTYYYCAIAASSAGTAFGAVMSFTTLQSYSLVLEGWQQVGPYVVTPATGGGTVTYDAATRLLTLNLSYSGLTGTESMAHIHGPGARGVNAGIQVTLSGANPKTDAVTLTPAQETMLLAGELYVNVHTSTFGNGEIRGQIDNLGATVTRALAVAKAGTGTGTVNGTAEPGTVINCGTDCAETVPNGKVVALTATPAAGSVFTGWSGDCTGTGACNVTMSAARNVTATFDLDPNPPRLSNISTRMQVLTGNDVMIGGFVIGGGANKTVVVRARGPSLIPFGITNALANPTLRLVRASDQATIATNDDWQQASNQAQVATSGFAPDNSLESAILVNLPPGAYTAVVSGVANGTGVGIVEVFEVDGAQIPLMNISTRGQVLSGNDVMIGGFVITGSASQTVVVRARGPSLIPFGITNALANPTLRLVRSSDQQDIAVNDNWQLASNAADITASGFAPDNNLESAILVTLPPGAYTAIVSGVNGGTGVGIVEVFRN